MTPKLTLPAVEVMRPGHAACPGCGGALAMRYVMKGLGPRTLVTLPACCWAVIGGPFPTTALDVPLLDCAFEATGASLSGMRAGLDALGVEGVEVVGFAGDGGTVDIGLQALSGMLERRTHAIYVMYDNEAYMNTGVQRSGSTPLGAWTTTTPGGAPSHGKGEPKKDIFSIVMAHDPAYAGTANVAFPEDLVRKVEAMKALKGPRFLHVLSPCPPGWLYSPEKSVELGRLATETLVFPLMEYRGGRLRITRKPSAARPVREYLEAQGRFAHLTPEEESAVQAAVEARWRRLLALEKLTCELAQEGPDRAGAAVPLHRQP